jgi:cytoskeletal protein CcmA (bactofilin family)
MPLFRAKKSAVGNAPPISTLSIIASGMHVTGDVRCDGVLRIDGTLEGRILGARQLVVTVGGCVRGDVEAEEIVVGGEIDGNVRATIRLELQGSAVVNGNIETRAFVVPEGGRVNGDIRMIGEGVRDRAAQRLLPAGSNGPLRVVSLN